MRIDSTLWHRATPKKSQGLAKRALSARCAALTAFTLGAGLMGSAAWAACAGSPCFVSPSGPVGLGNGSGAANATTLTDAMATVSPGGSIPLLPGSYSLAAGTLTTLGTLVIGNNTTLTGAGKDVTVIQRAAAATLANGIFLSNVDAAGTSTATPVSNVRVEALTLGQPGNVPPANNAALVAVVFSNGGIAAQPNVNVDRFFAFNVGSNGHGSAGFTFASQTPLAAGNNQYTNFIVSGATAKWNRRLGVGRGIWFTGQTRNIVIENGEFSENGIDGIDFNSGSVRNARIQGNQIIGNFDSGIAMQAFNQALVDSVPAPAALIDPRTGANVTPVGITIANNVVRDNGRFGIEAKGANGTGAEPFVVSGNTVSVTPGYVYRFSLWAINNALGNTNDALFGDCRDRAGVVVARLQGRPSDGNLAAEAAMGATLADTGNAAPSGATVAGNTIRDFKHPFNNIDATSVDLDPVAAGVQGRTACPTTPAISDDRDGFGLVLEGANNVVMDNVLVGNNIGIQTQGGNLNNSLSVVQSTTPTPYFDRGTGTPLAANTITHNVLCGNTDFDASKWAAAADTTAYPFPGNYFGTPPSTKLRNADITGFISNPYADAFIAANAALCGPIPDLSLAKANPPTLTVGTAANYTLTLTNAVAAATTGSSIVVNDKLPPNFQYNSAAASTGATSVGCVSSGTVATGLDLLCTVTITGGLAAAASASFTVNVTPLPATAGVVSVNKARVDRAGANAPAPASLCVATATPAGCAVAAAITPVAAVSAAPPQVVPSLGTFGLSLLVLLVLAAGWCRRSYA